MVGKKSKSARKKSDHKKFRVRGHIKSFRDLEIYTATTELSSLIYAVRFPKNLKNKKVLETELGILRDISKQIPKLIAEAYGDKFVDSSLAFDKLEKAMRCSANVVAKLDFLARAVEHDDTAAVFEGLIRKYQLQRRKILNLKRAWIRIAEKYDKKK